MQAKAIIQEIERLPLSKKFWIMEQTLKSIKKEELILEQKTLAYKDEISETHKNIIRERIVESKLNPNTLIDWDEIKNTF